MTSLYGSLYNTLLKEYELILDGFPKENIEAINKLSLGTCIIYIRSIQELLHTIDELLQQGFIESGGVIASALWERAITLRKILIDPDINAVTHSEHAKVKSTPWAVWNMVKDIIEKELPNANRERKERECKILYLQYTFLCSIKHGNPSTITYLNRINKNDGDILFKLQPNKSEEDEALREYMKLLCLNISLEALIDFSKKYRPGFTRLETLMQTLNATVKSTPLTIPKIIITSPEEMGVEFWEYLEYISTQASQGPMGSM